MSKYLKLEKFWWIAALAIILYLSYYIRAVNIVPDRLLSFDPIFQYRFTKYFADWGHLPAWDELTYYVGRAVSSQTQPFMYYVTAAAYWLSKGFGLALTLKSVAAYASAFYGAIIVIPAFLLGRELSNTQGGIISAALAGTAPQLLIRTFGSSYDTDQLVVFFILLSLYAGLYALRKRTIFATSLAVMGFSLFMLAWNLFWYTFFILFGAVILNFILNLTLRGFREKTPQKENYAHAIKELKEQSYVIGAIAAGIFIIGTVWNLNPVGSFLSLFGFTFATEAWIVNVSIAELQPINMLNILTWIMAMGNFAIGDQNMNTALFVLFSLLVLTGIIGTYKRSFLKKATLLSLLVLGVYTISKGIRFTEFSSAIFAVLIGAGFGYLFQYSKKSDFLKTVSSGIGLVIVFVGLSLGLLVAQSLGPDVSSNWENAWEFLRTKTPETSLVGTWWDPGHMITGLAERRVAADGAHCGHECLYTINDRITDLGKIFATQDENESVTLIRKYKGTSPAAYWIASDDLVGKYQWLQYFGTGCDARSDPKCQLYFQVGQQSVKQTNSGEIAARQYNNIYILSGTVPIPVFTQGADAFLFDEWVFYENQKPKSVRISDINNTDSIGQITNATNALGFNLKTSASVSFTLWASEDYGYIVAIPPTLRNTVFTRMFFLEGHGLERFVQVFRNSQVKIYEVRF